MNERLKELAKQAGHRYVPSSNSGPLRVEYLTPEMEKFAELIVRECAKVAKKEQTFNARYSDAAQHPQVNIDQCILMEFGL